MYWAHSAANLREENGCALLAALLLSLTVLVLAGAHPIQAERVVGSCTPELVHHVRPGTVDAAGSGVGTAAVLRYTDARGIARPDTSATVRWLARAIVEASRDRGAAPQIGGDLDLVITTADGELLTFTAACIAGSGAFPIGVVLYANGLTRGWPVDTAVRRSFVHFEAWTYRGDEYAYVALIDGATVS